ncbi:PREDICTED: galanin receptor type 3 [Galeopterus variegatus]|uniref:Galanin receptor type 3 n=1 Tax=Galeopterus variegatus TaxID=482537 RepID=A0ABM0QI06_GALVR|nr:PREDICTED: galanin receptor type 3 [Galeopterus variegatus]
MADAQNISLDSPGSVGAVAVPVIFALIFLLGTVGNGLVLAVLLQPGPGAWQERGSTTDLFILNLAVADLCFILCCVPFQAAIYTLDAWLFGALVCKAVHLLIYLTMYASSFTLAAVSVDRCAVPGLGGAGPGKEDAGLEARPGHRPQSRGVAAGRGGEGAQPRAALTRRPPAGTCRTELCLGQILFKALGMHPEANRLGCSPSAASFMQCFKGFPKQILVSIEALTIQLLEMACDPFLE